MTMNEELINQILRRILSDPSLQGLLQGAGGQARDPIVKAEALVLLNYAADFPRVLMAVQQRWGANYSLSILPSDQVSKAKPEIPIGMTWITVHDAMAKFDWTKLILPTCSANTLAKAALGIRDNPISEMIGRGISKGCSIELVTEYLGLTSQTPSAYRELYAGYLQKVKSYGLILHDTLEDNCEFVLDKGTVPSLQSPLAVLPNESKNSDSVLISLPYEQQQATSYTENTSFTSEIRFEKKFLGDKQAYTFPEDSKVLVKQGTVISPLARDTLKLRRIELCLEKEAERR